MNQTEAPSQPTPATIDPIARSRRRTRRTLIAAALLTLASLAWSVWPAHRAGFGAPVSLPGSSFPRPAAHSPWASSVDLAAFNAPLWVDPPRPIVAKVDAPAGPAPLRLQLIAILNAPATAGALTSAPRAILYDQGADKLITVAAGDSIGARTISAIDPEGVTVSLASGPQRLRLHPELGMVPPSVRSGASSANPSMTMASRRTTAAEDLAALMGRTLIKTDGQPIKPRAQGTLASPVGLSAGEPKLGGGPDR